jgi:hypothetical protein
VPGEIVVGAVDLDIPARLPRLRVQPAGLLGGNPPVLGAVNDQQRARRDRPYGVKRVQPCDYLVPLANELRRGGGEEAGELMLNPVGVKVERAEVGCCPEDGHRPQPRVGSRGHYRGPAAETVPGHGQPGQVNTGIPAVLQMVDCGGDVARDRAQVIRPGTTPAAAVVEHQRVPAAIAQRHRQVAVLLQPRTAVQEQHGRLRLAAARQVQGAEQAEAVAVEGHAGDALVLRAWHWVGPFSTRRWPGP